MITNNPFFLISEIIPIGIMQAFVIAMALLVVFGTGLDMLHKKNVLYFFRNAKKAKKSAKIKLTNLKKTSVVLKTLVHDIGTTSELGLGKRRIAHVLGMYGTIIFWVASIILIFNYSSENNNKSEIWATAWHVGAILTCLGGYWFWFFLRVDVYSEAHPWYRIIKGSFVLALLACATFGLAWSYAKP